MELFVPVFDKIKTRLAILQSEYKMKSGKIIKERDISVQ